MLHVIVALSYVRVESLDADKRLPQSASHVYTTSLLDSLLILDIPRSSDILSTQVEPL